MQIFVHPQTRRPIEGVLLGPWAELKPVIDRYASTDGSWQECPCPGLCIQPGCETLWVRTIDPSGYARDLLAYIMRNEYYLTYYARRWKMIPSPGWATDGRMDWSLKDQKLPDELLSYGFIRLTHYFGEVYEVTDAGRKYVADLMQ